MKTVYILFLLFFIALVGIPQVSFAQYKGSLTPTQQRTDPASKPIPKIFSSRVSSVEQAEKLDALHHNLEVSLWNFGVTDLIYQRELYALLEPERFKITRYTAEFEQPLMKAMNNLNANYKTMDAEIEKADIEFQTLRIGMLEEDLETIDVLWSQRLEEFKARSMRYFKMQNDFLNTYKSMVNFILEQGGSYAFNGIDGIRFYKAGGYQFFSRTLDRLRQTTFNQRTFLRSNAPVNVDTTLLANKGY